MLLFPVRSELAAVKDGAGAVKSRRCWRKSRNSSNCARWACPRGSSATCLPRWSTPYRQRAASEPPRELRRHPPEMRYTLLAALCWQRQREITDTLVELLIHIAHRVGVRAEEKVDAALMHTPRR